MLYDIIELDCETFKANQVVNGFNIHQDVTLADDDNYSEHSEDVTSPHYSSPSKNEDEEHPAVIKLSFFFSAKMKAIKLPQKRNTFQDVFFLEE